jgi:hypothetical protein
VAKYEKVCFDNQHVSIPFVFNTFGFLAPNIINLLQIVEKIMHNNGDGVVVATICWQILPLTYLDIVEN